MKIYKKISVSEIIVFMIFFFSSFSLLQINYRSITYFVLFEVLFIIYMIIMKRKIFKIPILLLLLMIEILVSATFALHSTIPNSYKSTAIYMTLLLIPSFFVIMYLRKLILKRKKYISLIRHALKLICGLQIVWAILQYLFFLDNINLNKIVFENILHLNLNITNSICGFSWHPGTLAPIIVLSYFLYKNLLFRILIIFVSLICNNATAFIGGLFCLLISFFEFLKEKKIKREKIIKISVIFIILLGIGFYFNVFSFGIEKIERIIGRITGSVYDQSAIGHIRYYTSLANVIKISSPAQILFGYGTGCSGYPIDQLYDQYSFLNNWAVESDFMNILYSWGIVGFILVYILIGIIIVKGYKIDKRYSYVTLIITLEGITYNVLYDWVLLLFMLFFICIKKEIDFWE